MFIFNNKLTKDQKEEVAKQVCYVLTERVKNNKALSEKESNELLASIDGEDNEESFKVSLDDMLENGVMPSSQFYDALKKVSLNLESLAFIKETIFDVIAVSSMEIFCEKNIYGRYTNQKEEKVESAVEKQIGQLKKYLCKGHSITNSLVRGVDWDNASDADYGLLELFYLRNYGMNFCLRDMTKKQNVWQFLDGEKLGDLDRTMYKGLTGNAENEDIRSYFVKGMKVMGAKVAETDNDYQINSNSMNFLLGDMQHRIAEKPDQMSLYCVLNTQQQVLVL